MNNILEFKTDFIENLEQTIFEISANSQLTRVYVSIGSKLNDPIVSDSQYKQWNSNALDQMFPAFLEDASAQSTEATLIIVIDKFTSFEYKRNELVLWNRLKKSKHTHIVVFNTLCDQKFLFAFINYLTYMCKQKEILSSNLLICNYVKFSGIPNHQEQQSFFISSFIDKLLHKTTNYKECLYEWFGYDYSLFNMIYKYKMIHNIQDNNGYRILKKILHNLPSNHIYQTKINNMEVRDFCKCMIDITHKRAMNGQLVLSTVYDYLQ